MKITQEKTDILITTLIKLHTDSNEPNITFFEYFNICDAITHILNNVEKEFSKNYMLLVFQKTSNLLNKTLGPLNIEFIQKLIRYGCSSDENGLFVTNSIF